MKRPKNLRLEDEPYPHLRDDEGCVLAGDYVNLEKVEYILNVVNKEKENDGEAG